MSNLTRFFHLLSTMILCTVSNDALAETWSELSFPKNFKISTPLDPDSSPTKDNQPSIVLDLYKGESPTRFQLRELTKEGSEKKRLYVGGPKGSSYIEEMDDTINILPSTKTVAKSSLWDEIPFSPDFRNLDRLLIKPELAKPNPWAHLHYPQDFRTYCSYVQPDLDLRNAWIYKLLDHHKIDRHELRYYKKQVIQMLAENWHESHSECLPIILITLDDKSRFIRAELYRKGIVDKLDKAALYAASLIKFPSLPGGLYPGEITFKIPMAAVQAAKEKHNFKVQDD